MGDFKVSRGKHGIQRDEWRLMHSTFCKRGTDLPHARLNPDLVREIRRNPNGWTARRWAEHLGVHIRTIEAVQSGKTWRHVR